MSKMEPKWTVAKVTKVDPLERRVEFEGEDISFPYDPLFQEGQYYKIDMMNICKTTLMWADSRFPSPIESTIVKPQKVECK